MFTDINSGHVSVFGRGENEGLVNDIDGGLPIKLEAGMGKQSLALGWVNAFQLKDHITTNSFKSFSGNSKKKGAFQFLANQVKEKDNPVLIVYTVK
ncbi:hypothetical protein FUAX_47890 (plasmid) [Fulvitalea axinellae]|uniref:Uncharacterized protein n=1 Tax=Fulvitalea axinellae TaxID=1182444 RepID=A0AAU9CWU7_9BACT|nr:hypothetical protein FUAX_47890 [Fulvitalea axinellae]